MALILKGTSGTREFPVGTVGAGAISDVNIADNAGITATKIPALSTLPNQTLTSVAVSGGVFNGDFENAPAFVAATGANNWIDGTAAGSASNDSYGYYVSHITSFQAVQFDNTVAKSGLTSMKISSTDANGKAWVGIRSSAPSRYANVAEIKKYLIPIKANTVYKMNIWCKTINAAAASALFSITEYSDTTNVAAGDSNTLTGTNDWTLLTKTWTTNASATYLEFNMKMAVAGTGQIIYFDDVRLMEVQEPIPSNIVATPLSIIAQAVNNTLGYDQSMLSAANSSAALGNNGSSQRRAQKIIVTRKYLSGVSFRKSPNTGSPAFDVLVSIQTDNAGAPSGTILSGKLYTAAQWDALVDNTDIFVLIPCIVTAGSTYWIVFTPSAQGDVSNYRNLYFNASSGNKLSDYNGAAWTPDANNALTHITYFSSPTEDMRVTVNGMVTLLKSDGDGILGNSVLDVDNARYKARLDYTNIANLSACNDIYSASTGNSNATAPTVVNYWKILDTAGLKAYSAGTHTMTWKVNTILPSKNMIVKLVTQGTAFNKYLYYSYDNVNFIQLDVQTTNGILTGNIPTLQNIVYLKYSNTAGGDSVISTLTVEADIETSTLPLGMIYPLGINQFSESYDLPTTATRLYFNLAKYSNANGVVMPAFAYSDSSGNLIGYPIFCPIDNSGETNPAVNVIIANTTAGQQVGTGSADGATGYILNDGEYMTLTGATGMGTLTYRVGKGTTVFSNITKNRVYLSSNGQAITTDRDQSLQANIQYGVRIQGEVENLNLYESEINAIQTKLKSAENTVRLVVPIGSTTMLENYGATDLIIGVPSTSSPVTVDLGTILMSKVKSVTIKDESGAANVNNITITTQGSELIDGVASKLINTAYGSYTLYTNGLNWFIR